MGRIVFVEVLDRRGRVLERTKLDAFPATIGRAYSNDVILGDRYASPTHLVVREVDDGRLLLEDTGSVNGVFGQDGERVESMTLESEARLRLGETVIRLVTPDHLVAPADVLPRAGRGFLSLLKNPLVAVAIPWAALGVFTADIYLDTYYDVSGSTVLGPALLGMVGLSLWAGVWAFANRVLAHRFDFSRHLAVACLVSMGSVLLWPLSDYADFFFSSATLAAGIAYVTQASLIGLLLYSHLSIIPTSTRSRRRGWALGVTVVAVGITAFFGFAEQEDFSSNVDIRVPLKSLGADWAPAVTTEDFLARSRRTKVWVDAATVEQ